MMKVFEFENFDKDNDINYGCHVRYDNPLSVIGNLLCCLSEMDDEDKLVITVKEVE